MQKQKLTKTITEAYTVTLADCGYTIICNSASPFTVTLPSATGLVNFNCIIVNVGSGLITCDSKTIYQNCLLFLSNNSATSWASIVSDSYGTAITKGDITSPDTNIAIGNGIDKVFGTDATVTLNRNLDLISVQFDISATPPAHEEGLLHWNDDEKCIEFGEPNGGSLQVGQEERLRAKNDQGATIYDGQVVYVCGALGSNVCVKLADADSYFESIRAIAVATEDVLNGHIGRFTTFGFVRNVNTGAWDEGDILYLSSTPGMLTSIPPSYPSNQVIIGTVTRAHATEGKIAVKIIPVIRKFGDPPNDDFTGFEDDGTMVFNGESRVYDDILNQLIGQRLESPSSSIKQDSEEGTLVFQTNANLTDYVTMNIQMSHSWAMGTDIYPHLHWHQAQNNIPNWLLQYRWQRAGQSKTTAWTPATLNANAFPYVSGTINQISGFPTIAPPSGYGLSDIVQFRILRDNSNTSGLFAGADPYTTDVHAMSFDCHFLIDTIGSREEYEK